MYRVQIQILMIFETNKFKCCIAPKKVQVAMTDVMLELTTKNENFFAL